MDKISGFNDFFLAFESLTQANFIARLKQEQSAIRRMMIRTHTIRETSFVRADTQSQKQLRYFLELASFLLKLTHFMKLSFCLRHHVLTNIYDRAY